MPTAAREPRGMLAAGSLRSPPMLKPAMTPERHPDGREGRAAYSTNHLPLLGALSWKGSQGKALPYAALQTVLLNLPWQLGRHPRGMKGTFVGWVSSGGKPYWLQKHLMAQCKVMRARETSGRPHKGPKATCWALSSAFQMDNIQERLRLSKVPTTACSAESLSSAAHRLQWRSGVPGAGLNQYSEPATMFKAPEPPKGSKQTPKNHPDATNTERQAPFHHGLYSPWTRMKSS